MGPRVELGLAATYVAVLGALTVLGAHRALLLGLLAVYPRRQRPVDDGQRPLVTVQLPLYNEAAVAAACIESVARLEYPRDRLDVQILDDSDDETRGIVDAAAARARAAGLQLEVIRRPTREGYKAGALAHGLTTARGELVAVFDADFTPASDFLLRAVPAFAAPDVGLVQARWDHANGASSLLTRAQALLLDGHFLVEQEARCRSGRPFNFNGTAGVLRRSAIDAAGGWAADTLTEDLDLSVRAQLAGWRFVFLDDLAAAGQLPLDMAAFRSQQRRWVQGSAQTARKLLGAVWTTPGFPLAARVETTFHLLLNGAYLLALLLALVAVPLAVLGPTTPLAGLATSWVFWCSTASVGTFLLVAQARRSARTALLAAPIVPLAFALGLGLSLSNGLAYLRGSLRPGGEFVRTPKWAVDGSQRYASPVAWREGVAELLLAAYCGAGAIAAGTSGALLLGPLLALFAAGFAWVGLASLGAGRVPLDRSPTDIVVPGRTAPAPSEPVGVRAPVREGMQAAGRRLGAQGGPP